MFLLLQKQTAVATQWSDPMDLKQIIVSSNLGSQLCFWNLYAKLHLKLTTSFVVVESLLRKPAKIFEAIQDKEFDLIFRVQFRLRQFVFIYCKMSRLSHDTFDLLSCPILSTYGFIIIAPFYI